VLCCYWKKTLKEIKQQKGLRGLGLMTCCNGRKRQVSWSKKTSRPGDTEKGDTPSFSIEDGTWKKNKVQNIFHECFLQRLATCEPARRGQVRAMVKQCEKNGGYFLENKEWTFIWSWQDEGYGYSEAEVANLRIHVTHILYRSPVN